ncbi:MAG: hypothetical protein FWG77_07050 [Treponema sp.]|nr:hypothetical protein [Treponema sp.]
MPSRNELLVKNTMMLYFRHILNMIVSLYTVRIKLGILGVEDFGIYNVVGGVVAVFLLLNDALTSSTERFIAFALGENNIEKAKNTYSIFILFHVAMAILLIILAQTIGVWLLFNILNIPAERHSAALVVYHLSVFTTVFSILRGPYHAIIIAYEKMSFFAFLSLFESLSKLIIILLLSIVLYDKLIVYAIIVLGLGIITFLIYKLYCNKNFEIAQFRFYKDILLIKSIITFSGWNVFSGIANTGRTHGINVLINVFFNVSVNAALGIAMQIRTAVYVFVRSFQSAFRPQIIKSYASQNYNYFMKLIFQSTKASFFLLFIFVLPLYLNAEFVLQIWLRNVPDYTVIFTRIILLAALLEAITNPLTVSINATGKIKNITLISGLLAFANLPISFFFLKIGFKPESVLIIKTILLFLTFSWLVIYSISKIKLPILLFIRHTLIPIFVISLITIIITTSINGIFSGWVNLIITCIASSLSIIILVYIIGLDTNERTSLQAFMKSKLLNRKV